MSKVLEDLFLDSPFQWSWGPLKKPIHFDFYEQWIQSNKQGSMSFLETHLPIKKNPNEKISPPFILNSILTVLAPYKNSPYSFGPSPLDHLKIALYAKGNDYHIWLKKILDEKIEVLKKLYPKEKFLSFVDSGPILERDQAQQLGLGWIGKNTCLMNRKQGSLFFIGQIVTTASFTARLSEESLNFCGRCTRCIEACPTGALEKPYSLDARLCISYLTIEYKKTIPQPLMEKMDDWFFGCDICQTVCPWNLKVYPDLVASENQSLSRLDRQALIREIQFILSSSNKQLMKTFAHTPLSRAGGRSLKRNALIVIRNRQLFELKESVVPFLKDPLLQETAEWCLKKLDES